VLVQLGEVGRGREGDAFRHADQCWVANLGASNVIAVAAR
jgi:hypothetical protein